MPRKHKICSPYPPRRANVRIAAEQAAVNERVDNVRVTPLVHRPPQMVAAAAFERMKLWENGRTLRVSFLDGASDVKTKVEQIAKEWEQYANLKLKFVTSGATELRVSFAEKGFSWSAVGTDALTTGRTEATINFGWLESGTSLREYQRVVRHEFGHALGMIHEHQNPAARGVIPWDKPRVYAYYAQQGWDKLTVDQNIFQVYREDSTNHSQFDPTSIMEYAIPDSLTLGSYAIGWNTEFSTLDETFMTRQYPRTGPGLVEIVADGPRVEGDLGVGGEVDTFHFTVPIPNTYIMDTQGPLDTILTLHGPSDPGAVVAFDDDLGQLLNARIVRKLLVGEYWLTVRHKDPTATGSYSVGLKIRK